MSADQVINPLATQAQVSAERLALKILASPEVQSARQAARKVMENHPIATMVDGSARLDYALDKWMSQLALQDIGSDFAVPRFLWTTGLAKYEWFGHAFSGSGAAIDCPDNIYRNTGLYGSVSYKVEGQLLANPPAQFSFHLTNHPGADGFDISGDDMKDLGGYGMLTNDNMVINADGSFLITLDNEPANGRKNHIQMPVAKELYLLGRDTLASWQQTPNQLNVERVGGEPLPAPKNTQTLVGQTAANLTHFVKFWLRFNDKFHNHPSVNTLVDPYGRTGSLGFASAGRFEIQDDQALVITVVSGGAKYMGMQVTDPWMIGFSPRDYLSSYNQAQSQSNSDGTYTYVLAPKDPGCANWVDTNGCNQGWMLFRWQSTPSNLQGNSLIKQCRLMAADELFAQLPKCLISVDADKRSEEQKARDSDWSRRILEPTNTTKGRV
jgi:hypothetical protein